MYIVFSPIQNESFSANKTQLVNTTFLRVSLKYETNLRPFCVVLARFQRVNRSVRCRHATPRSAVSLVEVLVAMSGHGRTKLHV